MLISQQLFLLVIIIAFILFIWRIMSVKDLALIAAKKHCQEMDVQFLDGSVVQCGIKYVFSKFKPAIMQSYQFEFTTSGERRYIGWTTFKGRQKVSMELQPHTFPNQNFH